MEASKSAVVICTKNRAAHVQRAYASVAPQASGRPIIIVDASEDDETARMCTKLQELYPDTTLLYRTATSPGLARQRNQGARTCAELGCDLVHYLDDDVEIEAGYFDEIERCFVSDERIVGVGGRAANPSPEMHRWFSAVFLLSGVHAYTVRRSGRPVLPQGADGAPRIYGRRPVRFLQGFSMSYKVSVVLNHKFDDRLEGYSYGEDRDFSFRVSNSALLMIADKARVRHLQATENRLGSRRLGYQVSLGTYVWVREQRHTGLSRLLCAWSIIGDAIRHCGAAWTGEPSPGGAPFDYARGALDALKVIAVGRASMEKLYGTDR